MPVDPSDPRLRRSGIGGSDIAAIAGVSRFRGAMDVWQEKIGQSAPLIETERMRWGHLLEDAVAKEYAHKTGRRVRNAPTSTDPVTGLRARIIRYSADKPWRFAHVDRLTSEPRRGLECKTADRFAGADFGEEGSDQVPPDYLLQCMWYLGVTGYEVWDLAVLIGGNSHRIYTIPRDEDLIEKLWIIGDEFWTKNVQGKVPPPIDGSEASRRYLEGTKAVIEEPMDMSDELYGLALHYANLSRTMADAEAAKKLVANQILAAMPGKGKARRDNAKVSWVISTNRWLDTKALAAAHPEIDLAPFYSKSTSEYPLVTVKEATT